MSSEENDVGYGIMGTGPSMLIRVPALLFYAPLRAAANLLHMTSLPYAGVWHPVRRHRRAELVRDHKIPNLLALLRLVTHSQGSLEGIWQVMLCILRGDRCIKHLISLSGPFDGAPLAEAMKFVEHLPPKLRRIFELLFAGILEMRPGSTQLEKLQALVCKAVEYAKLNDVKLPDIYLIAALHDGLVPVTSAWRFPDCYPQELVHRVLLVGGSGPLPDDLPEDVIIIRTGWGMDNHLTMAWSRELLAFIKMISDPFFAMAA